MSYLKTVAVPYLSQTDNAFEPFTACNVTCLAMCLKHHGVVGDGSYSQLEDQIYHRSQQNGWNRFSPQGLQAICESYGVKDDLTINGSLADIRDAIDDKKAVIVHGFFTEPSHLVVIRGYSLKSFLVNDPYGEIMASMDKRSWYYQVNRPGQIYGENVNYSNKLIWSCCSAWSFGETRIMYSEFGDSDVEAVNNMWVHKIG